MPISVRAGDPAYVLVVWKNKGALPYAPIFRLDLRCSAFLSGWNEGERLQASLAQPGETVTNQIYCVVPEGWEGDPGLDWKFHVIGIDAPVRSGSNGFAVL